MWIGLSLLSICELIQLVVELGSYGINKHCLRSKKYAEKNSQERESDHERNNHRELNSVSSYNSISNLDFTYDSVYRDRYSYLPRFPIRPDVHTFNHANNYSRRN